MVSLGPYSEPQNFTHMFDMVDLNGPSKQKVYSKNSLMELIDKTNNFSKFKHIIKLAKLENLFDVIDTEFNNYTMFIPYNKYINDNIFQHLDISSARHIVRSSVIKNKIPLELLQSSVSSYYITLDSPNILNINNINQNIYINYDTSILKGNLMCNNGIIHATNKLVYKKML